MSNHQQLMINEFISLTHCSRDNALEYLNKGDWKLDVALNSFFESNGQTVKTNSSDGKSREFMRENYDDEGDSRTVDVLRRLAGPIVSKPIIIPTVIEFQRFMQSFEFYSANLLENSSKMVNLALKCATMKPTSNLSSNEREHWLVHVGVDRNRLQVLLENEMCAPLVWIEHFEHLLNGNLCQLFDCDYMFYTTD